MRILPWMLSALALLLSGCLAAPLAIEATVEVMTVALGAADPNDGSHVSSQPSTAEQAQTECARNNAGPETECVAYMSHMTGSYY